MRITTCLLAIILAASASAQDAPSPTEELRTQLREWVDTMKKIQSEENDWSRDQEVLKDYKEALQKEVETLRQQIADAKTRKAGADKSSLDQSAQRDQYVAAKDSLTSTLIALEDKFLTALPIFPKPLLEEAKVAQAVEDLRKAAALPAEQRKENVSKRLMNLINLLGEAEKFQQTVHIRPELHQAPDGREFNMKVIYFGLSHCYAVNEDGSYALVGKPGSEGWKFSERNDLADSIQSLIACTTGEADAAFINLPLP